MGWTDYASAPPAGTEICDEAELDRIRCLTVESRNGRFPLLLVRLGEGIRAYVNACPHQYLPLDHRGDQIVSADGTRLMCTAHGAMFDIASGEAVQGADCGLDAVPLAISGGKVRIGQA
ncbi:MULTISPECIES: Rieske (2Fe-2S) protein [Paracoccus]|jgi:nitrite reductase/ring-hydroxylating ferredoxin subunit|uniref:Rieske (2Fe-2S) domain protein n=1 Tax=Paracoccus denitrificans (strain Pd 1222) TaxID=318586 RepID=A1B2L6_PARDP|nr:MULTISPECIES: Rieske 2Fe-2S domain-containing protein [Paracoccus]ABL69760.1 Rieske (2Fe-2S) domain protein [Paracoccus denitrificans PD1222]MBB4629466.1 nitrite reductase/ring-hydroxylating ferredoxin subunit [Paracoccus denitrificans]MCU7430714.1 Rieske 2Fe-2S domain-containing protein [Paracoccus denitrificans]MDK8874969.1 Rieske 2Fe-2S domain-containing protein [Paracoccus sp. SSJ]QAR25167.1 (2Fe-2S)-binding protein [Paracoccus denitrificans]